jgi:Tfp pilus assembly protein PilN
MIEINLVPGARKSKRSRTAKFDFSALAATISSRIRDPYMIAAVSSVLVALLAVGGLWLYQNRRLASLTERETIAVQDSTRYAAVIAQRGAAEAQKDSVLRQISIIKAIDGSRYVWPHILDEVSRALPPYVWLKQMVQTSAVSNLSPEVEAGISGADQKGGKSKLAAAADSAASAAGVLTFRIIGQTVDIQAMTRFVRQLEASAWIENVQLAKTDLVMLQPGNKEATEFTIEMKLQKPDSAVVHRVPLRILVR